MHLPTEHARETTDSSLARGRSTTRRTGRVRPGPALHGRCAACFTRGLGSVYSRSLTALHNDTQLHAYALQQLDASAAMRVTTLLLINHQMILPPNQHVTQQMLHPTTSNQPPALVKCAGIYNRARQCFTNMKRCSRATSNPVRQPLCRIKCQKP
jgi:hypothetical protein